MACKTTTAGITSYEFFKDGTPLTQQTSGVYAITPAVINVDDGTYTCVAKIDTVSSDESDDAEVACELVNNHNLATTRFVEMDICIFRGCYIYDRSEIILFKTRLL